jgi:hypothetical protein
MGEIERIETRLNTIQDELKATKVPASPSANVAPQDEDVPTTDAGRLPYQTASSQRNPVPLSIWVDRNRSDPAIKVRALTFSPCYYD